MFLHFQERRLLLEVPASDLPGQDVPVAADRADCDGNVVVVVLEVVVGDEVGAGLALVKALYFLFYSGHVGGWVDLLPLSL